MYKSSSFDWKTASPTINLADKNGEYFTVRNLPEEDRYVFAKDVIVNTEVGMMPLHNAIQNEDFTADSIIKLRYQISVLDPHDNILDGIVKDGYSEEYYRLYSSQWGNGYENNGSDVDENVVANYCQDIQAWDEFKASYDPSKKPKFGYKYDAMPKNVIVCATVPPISTEWMENVQVTVILPIWKCTTEEFAGNIIEMLSFLKNLNRKDNLVEFLQNLSTFNVRFEKYTSLPKEVLASAGFSYCGDHDSTKCSECHIVLRDWDLKSNGFDEHKFHSNNCSKVRNVYDQFMILMRKKSYENENITEKYATDGAEHGYHYYKEKRRMICVVCNDEIRVADLYNHKPWCIYNVPLQPKYISNLDYITILTLFALALFL